MVRLVVPKCKQKAVLEMAHNREVRGHFAAKKTRHRIKNSFFWPGVNMDIQGHYQACPECQKNAIRKKSDRMPITSPTSTRISDCCNRLCGTDRSLIVKGSQYASCMMDMCTRWPEVVCLRFLTVKAVCNTLLEIISRVGVPETVSSDQRTNFTTNVTQELLARLSVSLRFSTLAHPESNGLVEKWNGTFERML